MRCCGRYELTFARYEALVLLTFSRRGALPLRVIGERLMVHPTSVTNIISRLERQHLVVRRPNPADGRGRLAEITPAGRARGQRATQDLMAAEFGLGGYEPGELKEIFDLLRGLRLANGDFIPEAPESAARSRLGPRAAAREPLTVDDGAPGHPAVVGEPDRAGRGVRGQRDALRCRSSCPRSRTRPRAPARPASPAARSRCPPGSTSRPWPVARTIGAARAGRHRGGQAQGRRGHGVLPG